METERDRKIRERAYALWEQGGRLSGFEHEHWREAERSVGAGGESPRSVTPAPSAAKTGSPRSANSKVKAETSVKPAKADLKPSGSGRTPKTGGRP